jgi:hypothetical protein
VSATHVWKIRLEKVRIGEKHGVRMDYAVSPEEIGNTIKTREEVIAQIVARMMQEIEDRA